MFILGDTSIAVRQESSPGWRNEAESRATFGRTGHNLSSKKYDGKRPRLFLPTNSPNKASVHGTCRRSPGRHGEPSDEPRTDSAIQYRGVDESLIVSLGRLTDGRCVRGSSSVKMSSISRGSDTFVR